MNLQILSNAIATGDQNVIRAMWDRLHRIPGGRRLFSKAVGLAAPYTGSIGAQVLELRAGHSETLMRDRRDLRNHLKCIHAVALANLAELTGNIALAYSIGDDARFIVSGMSLNYVKKARGDIRGFCDCVLPPSSERAEYDVPVTLIDERGDTVVNATLKSLVGPKINRQPS